MTTKTKLLLAKLRSHYAKYEDKDSLSFLDEREDDYDFNARQMAIFREHPQTQRLIQLTYARLKVALTKLQTDPELSEEARRAYFVSIDWAKFFLDSLGEDSKTVDAQFSETIEYYAKKANLT